MKNSNSSKALKQLILLKEAELKTEGELLRAEFFMAFESLRPANIIKGALKNMLSTPDLKNGIVNATLGVASGYVAKKVFTGGSRNPLIRIMGVAVELLVASNVAGSGDEIRAMANSVLHKISGSPKNSP